MTKSDMFDLLKISVGYSFIIIERYDYHLVFHEMWPAKM